MVDYGIIKNNNKTAEEALIIHNTWIQLLLCRIKPVAATSVALKLCIIRESNEKGLLKGGCGSSVWSAALRQILSWFLASTVVWRRYHQILNVAYYGMYNNI